MTWLEEIKNAFEQLGGECHVQDIYKFIEENTDRKLPKFWRATVRREIEINSSDSKAHLHKRDLFKSVNGINNGTWRLREFSRPIKASVVDYIIDEKKYPDKVKIEIVRVIRDTRIVKQLKVLYRNRCQICGLSIKIKDKGTDQYYSEGHHIRPLGANHCGPDIKSNVLILCANHHVEFDYLNIAIHPKTRKVIHRDKDNPYNNIDLISLHPLNDEFLKYHYDRFTNR